MSDSSIARSSAVMAAGTFASRILGLVRNALLLTALGATASDTFLPARGADGIWRARLGGLEPGALVGFRVWGPNWPYDEAWTPGSDVGFIADLDEQGNLVVCGRVVEQINRLGENVSPQEIEQLLGQLEEIREVAVFGVPDAELGERTVAAVVTESSELDRRAVLDIFVKRGIARYKVPDEVVVVEAIPLTNIGKTDKRSLRALVSERHADQAD